jgi:hypothetical protein
MGSGRQAAERHIRDSGCTAYEALHRVIDLNEEASVGGPIQYGIFEGEEFRIYLQTELRNGKVRYPRGGLDLNASVFSDGADDLFLSVRMLEQGKILSPD